MKKTLVALAVTAFAVSASAFTAYDNNGTKVDVKGSLRVLAENGSSKTEGKRTDKHSNLKNAGSRIELNVTHQLADDFYALGYYRVDLNGAEKKDAANWGSLVTKKAYVGLGSKQYGQVTFGKQATIGDDIGLAGMDYSYGTGSDVKAIGGDDILTADGSSVIRYDYKGIEGLTLGSSYRFASERDSNNEVKVGSAKSGFDLGAIYDLNLADKQTVSFSAGYSRDSYATASAKKARKDGVVVGAAYTIDKFKVAADYGRAIRKNDADKSTQDWVRAGVKYSYADNASVYTNYGYTRVKVKGEDSAGKAHRFTLGTDYKFHKQVVTYVEGRVDRIKDANGVKTTDKVIGVGLRVFW